jgi:hypothetical protein
MKTRNYLFIFTITIFLITASCATVPKNPLIEASTKGDASTVQKLISEGANVNEADSSGYTPLIRAIWSGKTETVKVLLSRGADINAKDKNGSTPLLHAINYGYLDIAKILIDKGADVNVRDSDNNTPLLSAASSLCSSRNPLEFIYLIRQLIKSGADTNVSSPEGDALLDLVMCSMDTDIIHSLIKGGANLWIPEKGKARIFFVGTELVLDYSTVWVGKKYKTLNLIMNQGLAFYDVNPGKHTHYSTPVRSTIEVQAGQTYYFKIKQKRNDAARIIGRWVFTPASLLETTIEVTSFPEAEAKQAINNMLKLEKIK